MDDFLGPEACLPKRQNCFVGDIIVDEICPHLARIDKITHLNGRRSMGKNAWASSSSVARQVNCNVDFQFAQQLCYFIVATGSRIMELIKSTNDTCTKAPAIIHP